MPNGGEVINGLDQAACPAAKANAIRMLVSG
ncbi:hypothetical protein C100_04280 [Sphingobium sp. C100]|nr:hypothetical protein C100_04280 [Sphingobium sp. C100]